LNDLLSPAEKNEVETRNCCADIKANFLQVGRLLYASFINAYWSVCGHASFSEYLESLGVASRSWLSRLVQLSACIDTQILTEADVIEMGVTNAVLLLPAAKSGNLDGDLIEVAKSGSSRELREALGHKQIENDRDFYVDCPHCGFNIVGVKYVRKETK